MLGEKGLLKAIRVPTGQQEQDRQVVRLRDQLTEDLQRIKSFLLYHSLPEPEGLDYWSKASVAALQVCLEVHLEELEKLTSLISRLKDRIKVMAQEVRHAQAMRLLETHPGVGTATAMSFLTEVYAPERFNNAKQLVAYVGLAPMVLQSGETVRAGPLIKGGCGGVRSKLVEASWTWIRLDRHARTIYRRLVHTTGSVKKAIVAMARRMAITLWCMLRRGEAFHWAA